MESLDGIIKSGNGLRPWSKWDEYKKPTTNLIYNDIFGYITKEFQDMAVRYGWIKKIKGKWCVCTEEISAEEKGTNYDKGDKIRVINRNFSSYLESIKDKKYQDLVKQESNKSFEDQVKELL